MELFVSQGLIQTFLAYLMGIGWFAAIYPASLGKHQFGAKSTKITTSPLVLAV